MEHGLQAWVMADLAKFPELVACEFVFLHIMPVSCQLYNLIAVDLIMKKTHTFIVDLFIGHNKALSRNNKFQNNIKNRILKELADRKIVEVKSPHRY